MMTLEDVEKIMEETQEAVEYQQVSSIVLWRNILFFKEPSNLWLNQKQKIAADFF